MNQTGSYMNKRYGLRDGEILITCDECDCKTFVIGLNWKYGTYRLICTKCKEDMGVYTRPDVERQKKKDRKWLHEQGII